MLSFSRPTFLITQGLLLNSRTTYNPYIKIISYDDFGRSDAVKSLKIAENKPTFLITQGLLLNSLITQGLLLNSLITQGLLLKPPYIMIFLADTEASTVVATTPS
jgi:hypothetical protein